MIPPLIPNTERAARSASEKNKNSSVKPPSPAEQKEEIYSIIKRFGGHMDEPMRQLPALEGQLSESAAMEERGKNPEEEFRGGRTQGNLAAGLAEAIQDISSKIQSHPDLNTTRALKDNTKFLLNNPKVKALVENPTFQQMYPDFWNRMATYNNIRD